MARLLIAAALACVPLLAAPADPLADYRTPAKYQDTYPSGVLNKTAFACYEGLGNAEACICMMWNFSDVYPYPEAKAMEPEQIGYVLMTLYGACEQKHPPQLPIQTTEL